MPRRGRGEGGLTRRKDKRWQGSYVDATGKRRYVYGASRVEAKAKLEQAIADKSLLGPEQTVAAYLDGWLDSHKVRPITRKRYEALIRLHINPAIGHIQVRRLQPQQIAALLSAMPGKAGTVAQTRNLLRSALRRAVRWQVIAHNPADAVDAPKVERTEMRALTEAEVHAFLAAIQGDPLEALYAAAILTGARQGELLALRWQDVDLDTGHISINATLTRMDGAWERTPPKTKASVRSLPVPDLIPYFRAHRLRMMEALLPYRAKAEGDVLVFLEGGRAINGFHLTERRFKPLLRAHGLPAIRFHDLRHTAATHLLRNGVPPHIVSRYLGHASVKTTMDVYSHVIPGDLESAAQVMGRLVKAG